MIKNLTFYNHYGNGDLFISREFVKEIMKIIPAENYFYAHPKHPRMFNDIPKLQHTKITDKCKMRSHFSKIGNDIFINTWLGVDSKYVTAANSCSFYNSFRMFNDTLIGLGYQALGQPLENYIPTLNYSKFNIAPIDEFIKEHKNIVLICNCQAQSGQAENFDMTEVIQKACDNYPDKLFVVSDSINVVAPNYITTAEITKSEDGFDLNEISYLSKFSNLIVGRSSGFYNFAATKENCMNPNKTFLAFTYKRESAHLVWQAPDINAKVVWSNEVSPDKVYEILSKELDNV